MRLYTPAKPSSSGGDETERDTSTVARREKHFPYDPRPQHRTTESDKPRDDKLPGDTTTTTTTTTPQHSTIQDSIPFKMSLKELNGGDHSNHTSKQNGTAEHELSPTLLQNGADTLCSLDSVPWNLDGIETIKENGCKTLLGKWALEENGEDAHGLPEEDELHTVKEENKKLKVALKEATEVNGQWRQYHEQRQQYVQRLLTTLHELQHPRAAAHSPRQQLEVDQGGPEGEARRLQEALTRLQADHDEHVTLLEMQVRAHRDDWEAERSEKQATQTALGEAQARTALLLQELQLLQAKLADSESKRGLCWRCAGPLGGESHSASPSTHASPVPAPNVPSPSPAPNASPTPLQEAPQAPLKGWIPVSMLHQIAFSGGATPDHQTPVSQRPLTPSRGQSQHHHHHHHHHHHQQRPNSLSTKQAEGGQDGGKESKAPSPRRTPSRDKTPASVEADDRKKYEAMGARPKVLGNLQSVSGKEELIEDEKSAKHRARSILASALPVSPVSGSPTTPFGVTKSPSTPSMPKGYVPITSTVLTPVNFRPPFVGHKRPSQIKQSNLQNNASTITTATTTSTVTQSRSSTPSTATTSAALTTATTTTTVTSASRSITTPSRQSTIPSTSESQGTVHTVTPNPEASKSSAPHEGKAKSHSRGSRTQVKGGTQERKKSTTSASPAAAATSTLTTTTLTTHSTTTTSHAHNSSLTNTTTVSPSSLITTTTTTTLSSSSSTLSSSYSVSSANRKSEPVSSRSANQSAGDIVSNAVLQAATGNRSASFIATTAVNPSVASSCGHTKSHDGTSNSKGRSGTSRTSHKAAKSPSPLPETSTATTTTTTTEGQLHSGEATSTHSSPTNSTAFAAITVTSTASSVHVPASPTAYSSTPSSRSSSPGISLTTFGLNSEGRGIPGAIFFALSPEQRGARSPQLGVSSRRASTSSSGTHSHTPDPSTGGHGPDGRPPAGMKSPPVAPNRPPTPSTVKEEHPSSVESGSRGSSNSRQQQTSGKLVNSTWVKLMGSRVDGRQSSGLPWRTARAVSGQTLKQARRTPTEDSTGDPSEPASPGSMSSTATFSYTPAVNSPPSSATSSAASSPLPAVNQRDDLKSMASKNIASAIMSYELSTKCESTGGGASTPANCPDGVDTLTRQDLVCPSCQMLFPPDKHILFLDHFEACRGPAYADL
ncbi:mucin-2-like [Scylla paramamosain]|uniref:mucin-2-like n=1 Tax=Scylla paramamosain TaxID=85552 RepID=UPI003083C801